MLIFRDWWDSLLAKGLLFPTSPRTALCDTAQGTAAVARSPTLAQGASGVLPCAAQTGWMRMVAGPLFPSGGAEETMPATTTSSPSKSASQ